MTGSLYIFTTDAVFPPDIFEPQLAESPVQNCGPRGPAVLKSPVILITNTVGTVPVLLASQRVCVCFEEGHRPCRWSQQPAKHHCALTMSARKLQGMNQQTVQPGQSGTEGRR